MEEGLHHTAQSARELIASAIGNDPYAALERLRVAGRRKAAAEGVSYQMIEMRKVVLAELMREYEMEFPDHAVSRLEMLARSDRRYRDHIIGTAAGTEERELAQAEYWAIRSELEWDRASVAHLNAMARLED